MSRKEIFDLALEVAIRCFWIGAALVVGYLTGGHYTASLLALIAWVEIGRR